MSRARRPGVLRAGDRVRFDNLVRTVVGVSGTVVLLADEKASTMAVRLAQLQAKPDFELVGDRSGVPVLSTTAMLQRLPQEVVEEALWWERHLLEVIHGLAPDAAPGARPRPGFDPAATSLTQREQAKAAELAAAGRDVKVSKVKRQRQRYETNGLAGLVDHRSGRTPSRFGRADARVVEAMQAAIGEATNASTRTAGFILWRTEQILADRSDRGEIVVRRSTGCWAG